MEPSKLEFCLTGIRMTATPPPRPTGTPRGYSEVTTIALAASMEDSDPQAILNFRSPTNLDDRFRFEPQSRNDSNTAKAVV